MSVTDEYLANNARYAQSFSGPLPMPPSRGVAVVACMDARLNVYGMLGLKEGEAHVIRNAGGVITDDEIRSLAISQRLLGTREIVLIHHTDCGMLTFTDDAFKRSIQDETGIKPGWSAEAFPDLDEDVRQSIARIQASPSSRTPTRSAASSSTSPPASSTRSADRRPGCREAGVAACLPGSQRGLPRIRGRPRQVPTAVSTTSRKVVTAATP
jgi:carbonic anhydrase